MNIGKITLLALVAGGLGFYQYNKDLQAVRTEHNEVQKALASAQDALTGKKKAIAELTKALEAHAAKVKEAKTSLETEVATLQKDKDSLQQQFAAAVQQVRAATVSMRWPALNLNDGRVLRDVVVQAVNDSDIRLTHSGSTESVAAYKLPRELQDRLHYTDATLSVADTTGSASPEAAQAGTAMTPAASNATVASLETNIRQLQATREKLTVTKSSYVRQASDYRNKDALSRMQGKRPEYAKILPKVEASVFDLARQISEVSVQISNLEIELATIKSSGVNRS